VLTTALVWLSCRLISAIDADSSSAAPAAMRGLARRREQGGGGRAHCQRVLADRLQHGFGTRTELRDRGFHHGAAFFRGRDQVVLLLLAPPLGNVLMR
jgi:hypothetical protein